MKIVLSRHARRRTKLYDIPESEIMAILAGMHLRQGGHVIKREVAGFPYPIKIVVTVEKDSIM